jgi:LL-diaminopimelate aminotransferase
MIYRQADRLNKFQTGIFAAMDEKKAALIASGREVINLSIGTPDFKPPKHIIDAVTKAVQDPFNYRYSLVDTPEMLDALVNYYK